MHLVLPGSCETLRMMLATIGTIRRIERIEAKVAIKEMIAAISAIRAIATLPIQTSRIRAGSMMASMTGVIALTIQIERSAAIDRTTIPTIRTARIRKAKEIYERLPRPPTMIPSTNPLALRSTIRSNILEPKMIGLPTEISSPATS